jgi:hypothetical protein
MILEGGAGIVYCPFDQLRFDRNRVVYSLNPVEFPH